MNPERKPRATPPLTPSFVVAAANAFVGVTERGTTNSGEMVDRFLAGVQCEPGQPWCAAFVSHVGYWSHADTEGTDSSWPLPRTASCWVLGDHARRQQILEREPLPGDVFLVYSRELRRFAHTGIVVAVVGAEKRPNDVTWFTCVTIEGNTNERGSREGTSVMRKRRTFYPEMGDRFIRWARLDGRDAVGAGRTVVQGSPRGKAA